MTDSANETSKFIQDYLQALSGRTKTKELVLQFVSDPALIEHIETVEAAFPAYELIADQIVADQGVAAVYGIFRGTHLGAFAGIEPTGKTVSVKFMIFYRIVGGRIAEHWLQMDSVGLMAQLAMVSPTNAGSDNAKLTEMTPAMA